MRMFNLHLTRGNDREGVHLGFPASPGEIGEAFATLDAIRSDIASTRILDVACTVGNLENYIINTDLSAPDAIKKLSLLAEKISGMGSREQQIFSGALDAESVNGLDDVLSIASNLDAYTFLPNICSDRELGVFLVDTGYIDFPEHLRPYINYAGVGAEYYANFGGAYSPFGYVRRKDAEPGLDADRKAVFIAHLQAGDRQCVLKLPATDAWLDATYRQLQVYEPCEMELTELECVIPYLKDILPQDSISVLWSRQPHSEGALRGRVGRNLRMAHPHLHRGKRSARSVAHQPDPWRKRQHHQCAGGLYCLRGF